MSEEKEVKFVTIRDFKEGSEVWICAPRSSNLSLPIQTANEKLPPGLIIKGGYLDEKLCNCIQRASTLAGCDGFTHLKFTLSKTEDISQLVEDLKTKAEKLDSEEKDTPFTDADKAEVMTWVKGCLFSGSLGCLGLVAALFFALYILYVWVNK